LIRDRVEGIALAWSDLRQSLERLRLVVTLGWRDASLPYQRAVIGPYWITLHVAIWAFGIGYMLKGQLGAGHPNYLVYVTVGVTLFSILTTFFTDGSQALTKQANLIVNIPNPIAIHVLRLATKGLIELGFSLPVIVLAMLLTRMPLQPTILLALPGLALLLIFGFGCSLLLSCASIRLPDLPFVVRAVMRFMIFFTPVFWSPDRQSAGLRTALVDANPFYHFLTIVRDPLLGIVPSAHHYWIAVAFAAIAVIAGLFVFGLMRKRMTIWL
jgi:ABC-type polysaccharide/polyol phosphate export permease